MSCALQNARLILPKIHLGCLTGMLSGFVFSRAELFARALPGF